MAVEAPKIAGTLSAGVLESTGYRARDLIIGIPLDSRGLPIYPDTPNSTKRIPEYMLITSKLPLRSRISREWERLGTSIRSRLERIGDAISGC